jgi:hypothetical protein
MIKTNDTAKSLPAYWKAGEKGSALPRVSPMKEKR